MFEFLKAPPSYEDYEQTLRLVGFTPLSRAEWDSWPTKKKRRAIKSYSISRRT